MNDDLVEFLMGCDDTLCYATIPAPGNSGNIDFWFTSNSSEFNLDFSNEDDHFMINFHHLNKLKASFKILEKKRRK